MSLRNELGLTQEKLAWEAGLTNKSTLSRIENGDRLPSVETLDLLARRLDVKARDLLVFPSRGPVDQAIDLIRLNGVGFAAKVIALVDGASAGKAIGPGASSDHRRR